MNLTNKKRVALIFGGRGEEHDISIEGAKFVFPLIDRAKFDPFAVYIDKSGKWLIAKDNILATPYEISSGKVETTPVYPALYKGRGGLSTKEKFIPIHTAFPILHGDFGEDGIVQGALECAKIAFVGCKTHAGALTSDKTYTKIIAEHLGIPTAKWIVCRGNEKSDILTAKLRAEQHIGYPMFIKPTRLGSSVGASPVCRESEFEKAYITASSIGNGAVLIEELVNIEKELECAYFATKGKELFTNPGEISYSSSFYDYDTKYSIGSSAKIFEVSGTEGNINSKIKEYSQRLVDLIGIREIARLDYFLTSDGKIIFNEINTMPGFTGGSLYPRLIASHGIPPAELINSLLCDSANDEANG